MTNAPDIHIAVIDDDESLCRSMSRLLRAASLWPIAYNSAEEFIMDPVHAHFDCIVLDVQLDGMSGLELYAQLLNEGVRTPVVFITANDAPELRLQAEKAGCAGYFRKADSGGEVLKAIRNAMANQAVATGSRL